MKWNELKKFDFIGKPLGRLIYKQPMSKIVMDDGGRVYEYNFHLGNPSYIYLGQQLFETKQ